MVSLLISLLIILQTWGIFRIPINVSATSADQMVYVLEKRTPDETFRRTVSKPHTLILSYDSSWKVKHSSFLKRLSDDGHKIKFDFLSNNKNGASLKAPQLFQPNGSPTFNNLILADIEPSHLVLDNKSKSVLATLIKDVLKIFAKPYRVNILIFGSSNDESKDDSSLKKLHDKIGHKFYSKKTYVQDYFHNINNTSSIVLGVQGENLDAIFSSKNGRLAYTGLPHRLDKSNPLLFPLITGTPTTFIQEGNSGEELCLVSAFQTRENSRLVFSQSSQFCSDQSLTLYPNNTIMCRDITQWTFQQKGVIDWANLYHHTTGGISRRPYQVNDMLEFQIDLLELDGSHEWKKFIHIHDVQLEYTMLDPHWRLFLNESQSDTSNLLSEVIHSTLEDEPHVKPGSATGVVQFQCPDHYGIFKFVLKLSKKGYTFLHIESLAPIRNLKHDAYPRYLWCAAPYYASVFISLAMTIFCIVVFIHKKP